MKKNDVHENLLIVWKDKQGKPEGKGRNGKLEPLNLHIWMPQHLNLCIMKTWKEYKWDEKEIDSALSCDVSAHKNLGKQFCLCAFYWRRSWLPGKSV